MAYTDLRDFEPEYTTTTDTGLTIQIEKLGGGTLGKSYTNEDWRYVVTDSDGYELGRGQDLHLEFAATHELAAEIVAASYGEPLTQSDARYRDLRESGYTGPIDQDGYPVTSGAYARYLRDLAAERGEDVSWFTGDQEPEQPRTPLRLGALVVLFLVLAAVIVVIINVGQLLH